MTENFILKLDYIGSKRTLLPTFAPILDQYLKPGATFADLFCGTGVVSGFVRDRYHGLQIHVNDLQHYATTITKAKLLQYTEGDVQEIRKHFNVMNDLRVEGFFTQHYTDKYFSRENCERIDGCRQYIEVTEMSPNIRTFLLALLVSSADSVANTASVYGAYLKKLKQTAQSVLQLTHLPSVGVNEGSVTVTTEDICGLNTDTVFDVLYLDPPYNARQYGSNYHILETIVKYDAPELKGITLLPTYPKSTFCSKARSNALQSLKTVVDRFQWNVLMLSYSSDGIMKLDDITQLLLHRGRVIVYAINYKRFQSHVKAGAKEVT
jgi:adenine-specific DNA-methyltransferase